MTELRFFNTIGMERAHQVLTGFHGGSCVVATRVCPNESVNQDGAAVIELGYQTAVLIVADGAGGYSDGAYASRLVVDTLETKLRRWSNYADLRLPIIEAIEHCNNVLRQRKTASASTVVVAELQGRTVRHYLVGDSSIYVMGQRGAIRLQSVPQSVVGYGIESGFLPEDAALEHEDRHIVLNLVGIEDAKIELGSQVKLKQRDTILLCSDGLTDNLSAEHIIDAIRCGDLSEGVRSLMDRGNIAMQQNGGHPDDMALIAWRPLSG